MSLVPHKNFWIVANQAVVQVRQDLAGPVASANAHPLHELQGR